MQTKVNKFFLGNLARRPEAFPIQTLQESTGLEALNSEALLPRAFLASFPQCPSLLKQDEPQLVVIADPRFRTQVRRGQGLYSEPQRHRVFGDQQGRSENI